MSTRVWLSILFFAFLLPAPSCSSDLNGRVASRRMDGFPRYILWAWERPEDLSFIDTEKFGVAFLAQTLTLENDEVAIKPRRQPLNVPPGTKLIAVTRVESRKHSGTRVALNDRQRGKLAGLIARTLDLPNVAGVQIDFDVVVSERDFYRRLLSDLRAMLPENVPLSITALASFCLGDRWMAGLETDEAVPMIFRMGDGGEAIKSHFANGGDFREPLCRTSYGISLDESPDMKFDSSRRIYIFNPRPWTESGLRSLSEKFPQ